MWWKNWTPRARPACDTVLVDRPDDYAQTRQGEAAHGHRRVTSFAAIDPER
jgi:hypothetical protein